MKEFVTADASVKDKILRLHCLEILINELGKIAVSYKKSIYKQAEYINNYLMCNNFNHTILKHLQ